jgi:hypothetical protein
MSLSDSTLTLLIHGLSLLVVFIIAAFALWLEDLWLKWRMNKRAKHLNTNDLRKTNN